MTLNEEIMLYDSKQMAVLNHESRELYGCAYSLLNLAERREVRTNIGNVDYDNLFIGGVWEYDADNSVWDLRKTPENVATLTIRAKEGKTLEETMALFARLAAKGLAAYGCPTEMGLNPWLDPEDGTTACEGAREHPTWECERCWEHAIIDSMKGGEGA